MDERIPSAWYTAAERFERAVIRAESDPNQQLITMHRDSIGRGTALVGRFNSQGEMIGMVAIEQTAAKVTQMAFRITPEARLALALYVA